MPIRTDLLALGVTLCVCSTPVLGDVATVFRGTPTLRINVGESKQNSSPLDRSDAEKYACLISKIGDRYYWATRENKELTRSVSGIYVTYSALDGSGYVRICTGTAELCQGQHDYVEHLLLGLGSITYYGRKS